MGKEPEVTPCQGWQTMGAIPVAGSRIFALGYIAKESLGDVY
jgi:hypothetical protein